MKTHGIKRDKNFVLNEYDKKEQNTNNWVKRYKRTLKKGERQINKNICKNFQKYL